MVDDVGDELHDDDDDYEDGDYEDAYEDDAYEDDAFDDDGVETVACPSCGAEIYEDAERCMHCGDYVIHGHVTHGTSNPWQGRSLWWLILGTAGVAATIWALAF